MADQILAALRELTEAVMAEYFGNDINLSKRLIKATNEAQLVLMVQPPADRQSTLPPAADEARGLTGDAGELAAELRHFLSGYQQMRGLDPEYIYSIHRGDAMEAHLRVSRLTRAADLLQQQAAELAMLRRELPNG